ncbi:MAG: DUF1800 domain-containing protein [Rhodocyclaceae bacterium]|nr:DUF1800 domain-containing protein [Rhodocyclaceae bacterium]
MVSDHFILSRLAFGADEASRQALSRDGLRHWLQEQLSPDDAADPACLQRLAQWKLRMKYPEGKDWPATDELRPFQWLDAPIEKLWALSGAANPEKLRPRLEVTMATLIRAVYSRWQLRELLCDFWHNHFNVNAWDHAVGFTLPVYDREVVRRHCLGNFREMLEAVAKSPAMLWYLNNRSSRTGAPNENYARELFELHTLGRDAYLNALYNRWRDVPGAREGKPAGYIDQDVYEAARAFTGWGMEDGAGLGGGQSLPRTGKFAYVESWHDNYQKRVLATEFDPYQPPLADGRKVLDLAAFHPGTATHLARKLCIRLVSDQPSAGLIASTAGVWTDSRDKPDQIGRVVAHIVLSREFGESQGMKVKRPLELLASFVRAAGMDFNPTEPLIYEMDAAGQRLFGWLTPTGHPDAGDYWLGTNALRHRWSLVAGLAENWWATGTFDPLATFGGVKPTAGAFIEKWLLRLHGVAPPHVAAALLNTAGIAADRPLPNPAMARRLVAWAGMAPEFQLR